MIQIESCRDRQDNELEVLKVNRADCCHLSGLPKSFVVVIVIVVFTRTGDIRRRAKRLAPKQTKEKVATSGYHRDVDAAARYVRTGQGLCSDRSLHSLRR